MAYNTDMLTSTAGLQGSAERIDEVKAYIREHLDEPLNREVLAAVAGFSVPHFHRLFTAEVGENIARYVRRMRMERAGRKLRMGAVDITEVAQAAGYDSHAAFSKAFRQHFGLSPSEFRQLDCRTATQILRERLNPKEFWRERAEDCRAEDGRADIPE